MTKKIAAILFALTLAFASVVPVMAQEIDINVTNTNWASVWNGLVVVANTGSNTADGGDGALGGDGGDGGVGGTIDTGDATADGYVENIVNTNDTDVEVDCDCEEEEEEGD